jgi:hypothetical protein
MAGIIPHEAELEAYEAILRAVLLKPMSWVRVLSQTLPLHVVLRNVVPNAFQEDADEVELRGSRSC